MFSITVWGCFALCLISVGGAGAENLQAWSVQTFLDVSHSFHCKDSRGKHTVSQEHEVYWTKLGTDERLTSNVTYQLKDDDTHLVILKVTDDLSGIYICHVINSSGQEAWRAVWGLNIAGHLGDDLAKVRTNFLRGFVIALIVFIVTVGTSATCRYCYSRATCRFWHPSATCQCCYPSEEQRETREDRKRGGLTRWHEPQHAGAHNLGADVRTDNNHRVIYGSSSA